MWNNIFLNFSVCEVDLLHSCVYMFVQLSLYTFSHLSLCFHLAMLLSAFFLFFARCDCGLNLGLSMLYWGCLICKCMAGYCVVFIVRSTPCCRVKEPHLETDLLYISLQHSSVLGMHQFLQWHILNYWCMCVFFCVFKRLPQSYPKSYKKNFGDKFGFILTI